MRRRTALSLSVALLVSAGVAAAPAAAQTGLRITQQGPLTEDLAGTVVISGAVALTADLVPPRVVVQGRPATGLPCEPGVGPAGGVVVGDAVVGFGPFRVQLPMRVADSGRVQLCAYVVAPAGVLTAGERVLTARAPVHALRVEVPARVARGGRADVAVAGRLGAKRRVLVRVVRGAPGCGASFAATKASRSLGRTAYRRAGQVALSYRTPMLTKGTWTVCTYVQEALADPAAELVVARTLRAG